MLSSLKIWRFACHIICCNIVVGGIFCSQLYAVDFDPFENKKDDASAASVNRQSDMGPVIPEMQFNNNNISMILQIISDATGWSIFPTATASKANVSLWVKDITAKELLETIVRLSGLVYHQQGNIITVMSYDEYSQFLGLEKQVISLEFADAGSVAGVIKPFLTKVGKSVVHKQTNTIILYDSSANVEFILKIIENLDSPAEGIFVEVIPLKYANCETVVKTLKEVFGGKKDQGSNKSTDDAKATEPAKDTPAETGKDSDVNNIQLPEAKIGISGFIPANEIVVVASEKNVEKVKWIVEKLDAPSEDIIVEAISLKYVDCESLSKKLQGIFKVQEKNAAKKNRSEANPTNVPQTEEGEQTNVTSEGNTSLPYETTEICAIEHANRLLVAGTRTDVRRIKDIIALVDVASDHMVIRVIDLIYADAEMVAKALKEIFADEEKKIKTIKPPAEGKISEPSSTSTSKSAPKGQELVATPEASIGVYSIGRTNQVIVKAFRGDIEKIESLIEQLDTYLEPLTKNYHFVYVDVAEVYQGLEKILEIYSRSDARLGRRESRTSGITLVEKTNSILLTGPPSVHRIMASIAESIDVRGMYEGGYIRVYKIDNADVGEIATTIRELLEDRTEETGSSKFDFLKEPGEKEQADEGIMTETEKFTLKIKPKISVNTSTNSVVIQATSRQHRELEKLIKELDKRRKQVLIEAMILEVITSEDLNIGVELSNFNENYLLFSSFGLSEINPKTSERDVIVSPGGTGAVLRRGTVQSIIQALQSSGNTRITSAPQILINDNAIGFIHSVEQEPTTQLNVNNNVSTVSFSGYIDAGTVFAITPHISEKDYLRVEYEITLNSFGARSTDSSIPPPRNTTSIRSETTVPNGSTIVVGGLQDMDESESLDKVPLLGDLPLIGLLFQKTTVRKTYKTTYLFITPTIMQSEDFSDLKNASRELRNEINKEPK